MKTIRAHFIITLFLLSFLKGMCQQQEIISAAMAPPVLPEYVQPACPVDGYMWVPGYWAYDDVDGYYWVPGCWTSPPDFGLLWTPPYWEYANGMYFFHQGYWAQDVGFYGGINYGFGYYGYGFSGGYWQNDAFYYNTAVVNVDVRSIHRTYNDNTAINNGGQRGNYSFNGPGGVGVKPRKEELTAMQEQHFEPTDDQADHHGYVRQNRVQFVKFNGGTPAATSLEQVRVRPMDNQGRPANSFIIPSRSEANPVQRSPFSESRSMPVQQPGGRRH